MAWTWILITKTGASRKKKSMNNLLQLALDADFTNYEIKTGCTPTRALFTNVKELAYIYEVGEIIRNAVNEATASGGSIHKG
jgi:hypothetical protein